MSHIFVIIWESPKGSGKVGIINQATELGWLPQIGNYKYLLNIIIVAVLTVGMYIYLNYSKHGYEIAVVGESERTARYVGIKVEKVIVRTMLLSGAICGIAGLLARRRHRPHHIHDDRGRPRLHGGHGIVACKVQPHIYDPHKLPARFPRPRRWRDLHDLRS